MKKEAAMKNNLAVHIALK